jgi:hypothetical protein
VLLELELLEEDVVLVLLEDEEVVDVLEEVVEVVVPPTACLQALPS